MVFADCSCSLWFCAVLCFSPVAQSPDLEAFQHPLALTRLAVFLAEALRVSASQRTPPSHPATQPPTHTHTQALL